MISNTAARTASRMVSKRAMSSAGGPKLHKAKDAWQTIAATRPVDPHPHNVFHPPYNKVTVGCMIAGVLTAGYGSMYYGMWHQQKKQGYWK
mmetsp:Transcript_11830/g.17941  ORF Transcript_11830/g.17941 Transcript_11830/m.17941 type:complete len:91 (-) Transcript_11830:351-623(-)|eukprot:CAMPEP_0194081750 /NCGR_PEP_ID=MMETSP0149-20130528/7446_1 /TAXON_ID=122233 /ORGANISM="Chaetoceros debilis, Strain MM31A-1" /LENGTH=90 /DNA_ID=CAMNT_0038763725 /DNA_START=58 /DNA_END=330 /DNA_ORIENTATION=+